MLPLHLNRSIPQGEQCVSACLISVCLRACVCALGGLMSCAQNACICFAHLHLYSQTFNKK